MGKNRGRKRRLAMHARSCHRKVRHTTEYEALKHLHAIEKTRGYDKFPLKVYECTACGGWHFGHSDRPTKQKGIKVNEPS